MNDLIKTYNYTSKNGIIMNFRTSYLVPKNEKKIIDCFFDYHGYKTYQIFLFLVLTLILFSESLHILVITLVIKDLQNDFYNITKTQKSFLSSSVFIGLVIGSILVSKYLDKYGRKPFLLYGGCIILIFSCLSVFSFSINFLIYCRIALGIGIGIQLPAGINLASECIPIYYRSLFLSCVWLSFPIGEMYCTLIAWIIYGEGSYYLGLKDHTNDNNNNIIIVRNWRLMLLYCIPPNIICIYLSNILLESPRYLYTNKNYYEGETVLKKIEDINIKKISFKQLVLPRFVNKYFNIKSNNNPLINSYINTSFENISMLRKNKTYTKYNNNVKYILDITDFENIIQEYEDNITTKHEASLAELFSKKYLNITLKTWVLWCAGDVGLYLTIFVIPQILLDDHNKLKNVSKNNDYSNAFFCNLFIASIIALPKAFVSGYLAEILGRKKAMIYLLLLSSLFCVLLLSTTNVYWISFYAGFVKLTAGGIIMNIKVYSTEIYPTKIRGIGSSVGHAVGRILIVLIPFISEIFVYIFNSSKAPFILVMILSLLGSLCAYLLPYETLGRELDFENI